MNENLQPAQFRDIPATDLEVGHFLDSGRKVRVSMVHPDKSKRVLIQEKRTGARSPGVKQYKPEDTVRVWERKK